MPKRLSQDQRQLLAFLPDDGSATSVYALMAQLQEAGWRTAEIDHVMGELRELGELIVGRGGSGGSVRHVRNDRRALLGAVDEFEAEGTPCTRALLQQYMEWHPDYLEQVLDALLERGQIEIGPGRRGVITRTEVPDDDAEAVGPLPAIGDPAEDEQHLLGLVPETGAIGNTRLRNELVTRYGWDDERYWETRKRLRQRGVVEVGRGRGGSLRRVRMDSVALTSDVPVEPEPRPAEQRDEEMIWTHLPENGDELDLSVLQGRFEWNAPRFFAALEQMVADQKIHWRNSKIKRLTTIVTVTNAAPPTSPPAELRVTARTPKEALFVFVREHFEATSLRRFLTLHLDAERVAQDVAWDSNYNEIVHNVCGELRRSGYIDPEFFQRLRIYFTRLHGEIEALERFYPRPEQRG